MSYLQQTSNPAERLKAVAGVAAIHGALAAVVVAGLSVAVVIRQEEPKTLKPTLEFPLPPPPRTDTVVEPKTPTVVTKPRAADPKVNLTDQTSNLDVIDFGGKIIDTVDTGFIKPVVDPFPVSVASSPQPRNDPLGWITTRDYPSPDLRKGNEGLVRYRLVIGSSGKVNTCEITASSGHPGLDAATCKLLTRRARFEAARDANGRAEVATFSGSVSWQIPD